MVTSQPVFPCLNGSWRCQDKTFAGLSSDRTGPDLVAVRAPERLATFLDLNGYLPTGVPMLKRVLALPGQTVCRTELTILVDNIEILALWIVAVMPVESGGN